MNRHSMGQAGRGPVPMRGPIPCANGIFFRWSYMYIKVGRTRTGQRADRATPNLNRSIRYRMDSRSPLSRSRRQIPIRFPRAQAGSLCTRRCRPPQIDRRPACRIEHWATGWRWDPSRPGVDIVGIKAPNCFHTKMALVAARAVKPRWLDLPCGHETRVADHANVDAALAVAMISEAILDPGNVGRSNSARRLPSGV